MCLRYILRLNAACAEKINRLSQRASFLRLCLNSEIYKQNECLYPGEFLLSLLLAYIRLFASTALCYFNSVSICFPFTKPVCHFFSSFYSPVHTTVFPHCVVLALFSCNPFLYLQLGSDLLILRQLFKIFHASLTCLTSKKYFIYLQYLCSLFELMFFFSFLLILDSM